jgi:hypothetical protein
MKNFLGKFHFFPSNDAHFVTASPGPSKGIRMQRGPRKASEATGWIVAIGQAGFFEIQVLLQHR